MINQDNINNYIENFYGYGNWDSPTWFIGIEEGGGNSEEEVNSRISSWIEYKTPLIDIEEHHKNIGQSKYFEKRILQNTWRKLIRVYLNIKGKNNFDNDVIRDIQQNKWGKLDSKNALIELFPLPSPSHSKWYYHKWTDIDYLQTREKYSEHVLESRIKFIKKKIHKHSPEIVIFYSKTYVHLWNQIVGKKFEDSNIIMVGSNCISIIQEDNTFFVLTPHPSRENLNKFWDRIGEIICDICNIKQK